MFEISTEYIKESYIYIFVVIPPSSCNCFLFSTFPFLSSPSRFTQESKKKKKKEENWREILKKIIKIDLFFFFFYFRN